MLFVFMSYDSYIIHTTSTKIP